ncbi:MAG: peroxidase [Actinomycetia bacterium]|nr:peroxidase [Actinomycetes bacterium]
MANYTKVFAHRPEVYAAWKNLSAAVQANMALERYEVATIAAAQQRGSAYCGLAHARNLTPELGVETVTQIATGEDADPARRAIYDLAHQVAAAPADITADDLQPLRKLGFADDEIMDVVLTAAIRCFFSSVLSTTGAEPDPSLTDQDPALRGVFLSRHC